MNFKIKKSRGGGIKVLEEGGWLFMMRNFKDFKMQNKNP
jgi:hypothetical protein